MFVETKDYDKRNTFAIVEGSMEEKHKTYFENFNQPPTTVYSFDAYWISQKANTSGALTFGSLIVTFQDEALAYDNLYGYHGLTVEDVLRYADNLKIDKPNYRGQKLKSFTSQARAIFGNGSVWSENAYNDFENSDLIFKKLVDCWFELPKLPEGTSKWVVYKKGVL